MKTVCIVGYGRFGELMARLMRDDFAVTIIDSDQDKAKAARDAGFETVAFNEIKRFDMVVFAVPISSLEVVVKDAADFIHKDQLIMDVCSVKIYPAQIMQRMLKECQILATHPMFGPDSASKGIDGLQMVLCPVRIADDDLATIADFWQQKGLEVLVTTPERHDRDTIYSLGFTHTLAQLILGVKTDNIELTTRSFSSITEVARLSGKDTKQLFHDMLYYNPYFKAMKLEFEAAAKIVQARLDEIEKEQDALLGVSKNK